MKTALGELIRAVRTAKNISAEELSRAIDLPENKISLIEEGKARATAGTVRKLQKHLGIPLRVIVEAYGADLARVARF